MNRVCRLARRVEGPVTPDTFEVTDVEDAPLEEGQVRIEAAYGPRNLPAVLVKRLRVQGFIVFDFIDHYPEAMAALGETLAELYTGGNKGKLILAI